VSTEAELTRLIEDVNQYLEQVGWWVTNIKRMT
jgi:hypothetical protein